MEIKDKGLPIHEDATAQGPPADLPRGQLLRRRPAGLAVGARARGRRRSIPVAADRRAGAVRRSSSTRCRPTRARTCRYVLDEYGRALEPATARDGYQPLDQVLGARVPRLGDRQRRDARRVREHDLSGYIEARRHGRRRRSTATPAALQGAGHRPRDHRGRVRVRGGATCAPRSASCRARCARGYAALGALNEAFPPLRRARRRPAPAVRAPRPGARRRSCRSCAAARARLPEPSCAASSATCGRRSRRPRRAQRGRRRRCRSRRLRRPAARTTCCTRGTTDDDPRRALPGPGPVYQEARQVAARHRRRSRSLRRQRPVRPLAARRRRNYAYAASAGAVRYHGAAAARASTRRRPSGRRSGRDVPCETQEPPDLRSQRRRAAAAARGRHPPAPAGALRAGAHDADRLAARRS